MLKLLAMDGVGTCHTDLCQFGLTAEANGTTGPAQKPTRIASNSAEVLKRLEKRCPNHGGNGVRHTHVTLMEGRAKQSPGVPEEVLSSTL